MRPSGKTWSLTVRNKSLHLDAPHGSFEVRGLAPEVVPVVAALPEGTDVECEGMFDGGGTITHLVVTKVRRILKDMTGRIMTLPDAIIAADGRLAAARARKHFSDGNIEGAAADVGALLRIGDDQGIGEFERLPAEHQQQLTQSLIEWAAEREANWRALRHIPLRRWTDAHLDQAFEQSLANGGVFGAAPGIRAEDILDELYARQLPTATRAKQLKKLRKAQSTEGDTYHRITTDVDDARVIGADAHGIYVCGTTKLGESITQEGAHRRHQVDRHSVIVQYGLDGGELRRFLDLAADHVIDGVALRTEATPAGIRLGDGKQLYHFAYRIAHHDGELLWGIHECDHEAKTMRSEIRRITNGEVIAQYDRWIDAIEWDGEDIVLDPAPPETIAIETAAGTQTIPYEHAPWRFRNWKTTDTAGWIVHHDREKLLYLAPSERGATYAGIELQRTCEIDLAPPWLAFRSAGSPIILVAIAELMSAAEIRIDGKRFARRIEAGPRLVVAPALVTWFGKLVDAGLLPARSNVERDALLFRLFDDAAQVPRDGLAKILLGESPWCIEHSDNVDQDDPWFAELSRIFDGEGVAFREVERSENPDYDPDDNNTDEHIITIEATRQGKTIRRRCTDGIRNVAVCVDKMLEKLGSERRLFALPRHRWKNVYLAITREQRRVLAAAGIEGIGGTAEARD